MSMFVRSFQNPDARYAIGAMVSWLVYGALYIAMLNVVTLYAVASGISWYSLMALSMRSKNMARSVL
jgi:hypothetical protein